MWQGLLDRGVLVRQSGPPGWLRVSVGTPTDMEIAQGPDGLRDIVLDVLGDRDIPVLGNVDIGHSAANIPLPLGVRAELDADARTLSLLEGAVIGGG